MDPIQCLVQFQQLVVGVAAVDLEVDHLEKAGDREEVLVAGAVMLILAAPGQVTRPLQHLVKATMVEHQ
jgi:hypothetical protein